MQSSKELSELYRIRFETKFLPRKNEIWKVLCSGFFQKYIKHDSSILDVACGYGEFINNIDVKHKYAIDLNTDTKGFLDSDVEFKQLSCDQISEIGEEKLDYVFTSNFLEHLPDKKSLEQLLEQVLYVLKPGGKFMILGPNLRYLPGEYWDFYDHHLGLTHLSLSEALELKGFRVESCIDRFLPYTTQGSLPTHPFFVQLYLKFPFIWRVLGKQFFVVGTKA